MSSNDQKQDVDTQTIQDANEPLGRWLRPIGANTHMEIAVTRLNVVVSIYDAWSETAQERIKHLSLTHEEWRLLMSEGFDIAPEDYIGE